MLTFLFFFLLLSFFLFFFFMRSTLDTHQTMGKSKSIHPNIAKIFFYNDPLPEPPPPPGPMTCGKPEQPPNSTMVAANYNVDSEVEYRCDPGHVLIGPAQRTCLESGFFDEFPPTCRCEFCCSCVCVLFGRMNFLGKM